jgi:hypothetical protein
LTSVLCVKFTNKKLVHFSFHSGGRQAEPPCTMTTLDDLGGAAPWAYQKVLIATAGQQKVMATTVRLSNVGSNRYQAIKSSW